jgi:hypothetical protein
MSASLVASTTRTRAYYLAGLAGGQYWFACIVEKYTNDTYAVKSVSDFVGEQV